MVASTSKKTAATVCALVAAGSLTAIAPAAHGQVAQSSRVVLRDGPGDVWKFDPKTETSTRVGDFPLADVTRMVVVYRRDALRIRMRFVNIRPVGTQLYWNEIRTPKYHLQAVLTSKPGHRQGQRYFQGDDGATSCPGFTRKISYRRNVVEMLLPSKCLHAARWVQLGTYNELYYKQSGPDYFDQPTNHLSPVVTPGQTRRIYRPTG